MESIFIPILSLFILIPILYFLPIGFTKKGKLSLVIISFCLAIASLLAMENFPLWQSALMLLLLVLLLSYVMDKRLGGMLYCSDQLNSEIYNQDDFLEENITVIEDSNDHIEKLEMYIDQSIKPKDVLSFLEETDTAIVDDKMEKEVLEEDSIQDSYFQQEKIREENNESNEGPTFEGNSFEVLIDEISFLHDREDILDNGLVSEQSLLKIDEKSEESIGYMSEIEQLLENDQMNEIVEMNQNDHLSIKSNTNWENDEIELFIYNDKKMELVDIDLQSVNDPIEIELEILEEIKPTVSVISNQSNVQRKELDVIIEEEEKPQQNDIQQLLLHTMVEQIQIARKQVSQKKYEYLIKDHMHPDLSQQDYYIFASLLMEHYIRGKELVKLQELLTSLKDKFIEFPIINLEIQHLYKQYCEKTL